MTTEMIPATSVARICGQRDKALAMLADAAAMIERGHALAMEARKMASTAASGAKFTPVDRSVSSDYGRLFTAFDRDACERVFREHTDACVWVHLLQATGMDRMMDATALQEFMAQLSTDPVEVSEDNVYASLQGLAQDSRLIFQRGLARAFADLDPRFKSHDAFKLGARIIITRCFNEMGSWSYYTKARATIRDVERVLAVLDGQAPDPGELEAAVDASREGWGPRQGYVETRYLRIRTFKNGNAHLWFTRDDLVEKANLVLADYYGEVLPDAVPADVEVRTTSGLPSRDLAFYRSPPAVVQELLAHVHMPAGARALEPSAGDGAIVRGLLDHGVQVDAVEIDPGRVQALGQTGARVLPGNFLRMPARAEYDVIAMNPPFCGTHWMEHVVHAYDFLAPGGTLRAVLPATAEVGQSAKHKRFRAWATERSPRWARDEPRFYDLPPESFASSGTRIQTVILELCKRR